ncbi:MAG TPA: hydantoinase/oxoprolinase family protein [Pirellulales bacterium]|nr:hydantoinase/oxoprolinase family protein [Pirellulales bacterium]
MPILALDVGGANLKIADGAGHAASVPFPLWKMPERLPAALSELIRAAPPAERFVATMTGELADCFETKADGVRAIITALEEATADHDLRIYLTDGSFVAPAAAMARPLEAAASNWYALACFVARYVSSPAGLLIDIGSTTCDIIPLVDGRVAAEGRTDPARLASGELVYTGVVRSPVCAVARNLPWQGRSCPTAHELFATTRDAYLLLGELAEDPAATDTADGRPATRAAARDRLARTICADRHMFSADDALVAAEAIREAQVEQISAAVARVVARLPVRPVTIVLAGEGEFLAYRVINQLRLAVETISLSAKLGPIVSRCAPAHALAVLARESRS